MPVAEGRGGGLGRTGGGATNDGAGPEAAAAWAGVETGLWAAGSQTQIISG